MKIKEILKRMANPVKRQLFKEMDFNAEEEELMKQLYINRNNQEWVAQNLSMSQTTVTNIHKLCLNQIENYYCNLKYRLDKTGDDNFYKFFG